MLTAGYAFDAYLPGARCSGVAVPLLNVQCRASDDPWPLGDALAPFRAPLIAGTNYFDGRLFSTSNGAAASSVPPFFSAAYLLSNGGAMWWFAGTDGRGRAYSAASAATEDNWGSDLAGITSDCDHTARVVVSGARRSISGDTLHLIEMRSGKPVEAGPGIEVEGTVSALWSSADGRSANVVIRQPAIMGGTYAAYSLTVRCHQ
jgi:hypothetical protein